MIKILIEKITQGSKNKDFLVAMAKEATKTWATLLPFCPIEKKK